MSKRNRRVPTLSGSAADQKTIPDPEPTPRTRTSARRSSSFDRDPDVELGLYLGERARRVALGLTAALLVARAFWPSEPDIRNDAGGGLVWVFAVLIVVGLALASALLGGTLRARWSWADLGMLVLVVSIALASRWAIDRRPAINVAWEWGGIGLMYLLARNLPRTPHESKALAAVLAATAVAVAVYGLYQVGLELPEVQRKYRANPEAALRIVGITPGTAAQTQFENRLLGSNEPYSTFALANSLAGFLVGPLVLMLAVGWDTLTRRDCKESRWAALALAGPPILVVLVCLILTKSRSAAVGLVAALLVLAWRERNRVRPRTLALAAAGGLAVVCGLVAAGLATGRLDRQVLTESGKSLRYRQEYWIGAWRAIAETPASFWHGYGPANFSAAYLRHKLPQASEEISDPHNFLLEVWAAAGVPAVLGLSALVGFGLWNAFGPSGSSTNAATHDASDPPQRRPVHDPSAPPPRPRWLIAAGAGGWVLVLVVGQMSLFTGDAFARWLVLGGSWALAVACGWLMWRRHPLDPFALGAAALAVLVNLLAAGGIGTPTVALGLWTTVALAQNLRADHRCGRLRDIGGRAASFGFAAIWVAILGTFVGAVTPFWKAEAALAEADDALRSRPPAFERAEAAFERAKNADPLSARPWLGMAELEYAIWMDRGAKAEDLRWRKIPIEMYKAVSGKRPANNWSRHRARARMTSLLMTQIGSKISPLELTQYRGDIVNASRTAALLYPTNASLRAWLAEASAEIGMIPDAVTEGREALRLDALTPHGDKKLEPAVRLWLESMLPRWEKAAAPQPAKPGM
jgi:O-antigen ligase